MSRERDNVVMGRDRYAWGTVALIVSPPPIVLSPHQCRLLCNNISGPGSSTTRLSPCFGVRTDKSSKVIIAVQFGAHSNVLEPDHFEPLPSGAVLKCLNNALQLSQCPTVKRMSRRFGTLQGSNNNLTGAVRRCFT